MGWLYEYGQRRNDLIAERTQPWESGKTQTRVLRHCYRGTAWAGVLYMLIEQVDKATGEATRFIEVDKIAYAKSCDGWGYKDMDETCHPYYYGCPKSYVRACTAPINEDAREWRTKILGEAEVEERWPKNDAA